MYRHYWKKYPVYEKPEKQASTGISVVIAFRNEESTLPNLLESLNKQVYPGELREFVLVNDHSDDRSLPVAEAYARMHPGFHCISNETGENGKKAALYKGLKQARFGLIVFTDADCRMEDNWLSTISGIFSEQRADMIIGLVDMDAGPGLFNRFQEIEFLSLVGSGAAAAAAGRAIFCNAANMAFTRELFNSYTDPLSMAFPSGDDTLFMLKVKTDPARRIVLMKSVAGSVTANGTANLRQFFNQRIRWASKSRLYADRDILYTSALVLGISVILPVSALALVMGRNSWLFPAVLIAKSAVDYLFLRDFMRFYAKKIHPGLIVLFEAVYPVYILITAILGLFGRYSWKGR